MPISGLVLTVAPSELEPIARTLAEDPRFDAGPPCGPRLPVVVETGGVAEDRAALEWLEALPGVTMVELAWLDFSDIEEVSSPELRRMGRRHDRRGGAQCD